VSSSVRDRADARPGYGPAPDALWDFGTVRNAMPSTVSRGTRPLPQQPLGPSASVSSRSTLVTPSPSMNNRSLPPPPGSNPAERFQTVRAAPPEPSPRSSHQQPHQYEPDLEPEPVSEAQPEGDGYEQASDDTMMLEGVIFPAIDNVSHSSRHRSPWTPAHVPAHGACAE
jgi:serine/threonine-protein kinase 24/25/MST4